MYESEEDGEVLGVDGDGVFEGRVEKEGEVLKVEV